MFELVRTFIQLPVVALIVAGLVLVRPVPSSAAALSLVRDAEIETTIRTYATPIFQAAGLDPSAVEIFIVSDKSINAFVAGGQKLFLNTGLLMRSDNANQVIGVIAHEVGHIVGAHLARAHDAMRNATAESIIAMVLGAAAAAAGGRPEGIGAAIQTGREAGLRSWLAYSRTQEGAADGAAMRLMDQTGQSTRGLLAFLQKLEDQELLSAARQDPYLRSHPLSRDRILALEDHVRRSPYADAPEAEGLREMHKRMVAKLVGYYEGPQITFRRYPESDSSIEARYARAWGLHRQDLDQALAIIDSLIAERPADAFFHEARGFMLWVDGRPADALGPYEKAVELMPSSALLRFDLARVQLAFDDPAMAEAAIRNLRVGLAREPRAAGAWDLLGQAYHLTGDEAESALARAEHSLLTGRREDAAFHAGKAIRLLPQGSPGWLQAQDILQQAERKAE